MSARFFFRKPHKHMETPQSPDDPDALPSPQGKTSGNRKLRKNRIREAKETLYGIELRRRMIRTRLMIAGVALVLVAIFAAVALIYPGTQGFRSRLDRMVADATGAEVMLQGVDLSAFRATARQLDASWPADSPLASFRAEYISADVMPHRYFRRSFGGDEMRAASGRLMLRYPDADVSAAALPGADGKSSISFHRIGIPNLDVHFGDASETASALLLDAEAAFYPRGPGGLPRAMLYSGSLDIPFWPVLVLERALIEFPKGSSRIVSMRVRDGEPQIASEIQPGSCDISGEILHDSEVASSLDVMFEGFQLQSLIGEQAGRIFIGRVDSRGGEGSGIVRVSKQDGVQMRAELVASGNFHIAFSHFPFLRFLSEALDDNWFRNPIFDDAPSMVFIRDGADLDFEDLDFTARHRMAIRGSISINVDDEITGEIELGLAPGVINVAIARRIDGMFSAEREGFRWITLELGGTTQMPMDNFNAQFIDAPLPEAPLRDVPLPQPEAPMFEPLPPAEPPPEGEGE